MDKTSRIGAILGCMLIFASCVVNREIRVSMEKRTFQSKEGKVEKGRKLVFESTLNCSANTCWKNVEKPGFWIQVLRPQAILRPLKKTELPVHWEVGETYPFRLTMSGFIPFGKHFIEIKEFNVKKRSIRTHEHGLLVPQWDNHFEVEEVNDSTCLVRDVLYLSSSGVDGVVAAYAKDLFKGKHKRLKNLWNSLVLALLEDISFMIPYHFFSRLPIA